MKVITHRFNKVKHICILTAWFGISTLAYAGTSNTTTDSIAGTSTDTSNVKQKKRKFTKINFSGYVRSLAFYRNMDVYPQGMGDVGRTTFPQNISLGDDYDEPMIVMRMEASPFTATKIIAEIGLDNRLLRGGSFNETVDENGRLAAPTYNYNFEAQTVTGIGSFKLIAGGGVNWYQLSQMTLWSANELSKRDDLFERVPWLGNENDFDRYNNFYQKGSVFSDRGWGNAATQGVIIEGSGLPGGFGGSFLIGKSSGSSGFQSWEDSKPMYMAAARLEKTIGNNLFAVNYIDQWGHEDNIIQYALVDTYNNEYSVDANGAIYRTMNSSDTLFAGDSIDIYYIDATKISQFATTLEGKLKFGKRININFEAGLGSYLSYEYNDGLKATAEPGLENMSDYKRNWDELLYTEIYITDFPLMLQAYRVGENYVNPSSAVRNSSIESAGSTNSQGLTTTACYPGLIPNIGEVTNNRQGLNLFFNQSLGALKTKIGYGISQELKNLAGDTRNGLRSGSDNDSVRTSYTNSITFQHNVNSLSRSRFGFFETNSGYYDRLSNPYRQSYETINITDTSVDYKKSTASLDLELKYKFILLNRPIIISNYVLYTSVQDKFSIIPKFNDDAFLRYFYEEFIAFYNVRPKLTVLGMVGLETVKGNMRTELADSTGNLIKDNLDRLVYDESGKPIDQFGYALGFGFDYKFHRKASLNFRNKWYAHTDEYFDKSNFKGYEATLELKVFF